MPWLETSLVFCSTALWVSFCQTTAAQQERGKKVSHKSDAADSWRVPPFFSCTDFFFWTLLQSDSNSSSPSRRNQWSLFSLPRSLTSCEWQAEKENYWCNRAEADEMGLRSKRWEAEKKDRQIFAVRKDWKEEGCNPLNEKVRVFSVLPWSAKRKVSHSTHLNWERPIDKQLVLEAALWGRLIMREADERRLENKQDGIDLPIVLSVKPKLFVVIMSLAHPLALLWRFASSPLNPCLFIYLHAKYRSCIHTDHTFLIELQL